MEWHTWYNLIKDNLAKKQSEKTLEKEERRDEEEMKVLDCTLGATRCKRQPCKETK